MSLGSTLSHASRRTTLSLVAVGAMAASFAIAVAGPAAAAPANQNGRASHVIVVLRDQHTNLAIDKGRPNSPRSRAYRDDQAPLIGRARDLGARNLHGFSTVNAVAATVTPGEQASLAADPSVAAVFPDLPVKAAPLAGPDTPASSSTSGPTSPVQVQSGICPTDPAKPLLEPEALQITNTAFSDPSTPQAQNLVDGKGVTVAFIADGLDINNPDFIRADGSHVFSDYQDFSGDGTAAPSGAAEAFGDASAIAAQGRVTYDLADYVIPLHPLPPGCTIRIRGMAPGANLMGLKVFGNSNTAPTSRFIEAIDYAVAHGADVLNESFGGNPYPDTGTDPISLADASAIAAGVTVVASTGDAGVNGTVGSPASADIGIIGVGATTQFRSYLQQDYAGADLSNGTWVNNNISGLSSGGITQANRTPDLVAPGDLGWALCTPDLTLYTECADDNGDPSPIQDFGGTSQSSPLTAGAAALVIQAYERAHHGARPAPAVVKQILTGTATDLGHPAYEQGAGELNSLKAVLAAESWRDRNGRPDATGSTLVVDKTQLSVAGHPSTRFARTLAVTNVGGTTQRVTASTRTLGRTVRTLTGSALLDAATAPIYIDSFGIPRSYVKVTFPVDSNVDRITMLEAGIADSGAAVASRIILIDPNGVYTAYSIPQGAANYAMTDARYPTAGTWTAYIAVPQTSGFHGTINWKVDEQDFTTDGGVYPSSFTLRPGATRRVTVIGRLPSSPGDVSASVQLNGSASGVTSVPMSLRAVVPPRNTSFTGTLLGGNGRGFFAEANIYYLDVPRRQRNLGVGVRLQDSGQAVLATLTAPNGQTYSWNSNASAGSDGSGIQDYVDDPMSGRWVLTLETVTPSSGMFTHSSYRVAVAYNTVRISAQSLPTSTRTRLPKGTPVTLPVTITNTGAATLTYFADARLDRTGTLQLANVGSDDTFPLPEPANQTPEWLLPTHTSSMTVTADGHGQPVNLDVFWQGGNPDVYSAAPASGPTSVTASASQLSQSFWVADIGQTGPFGTSGAPTGTVTVSASAVGQLFDTDVSTSTGDFWLQGLAGQSADTPVPLGPIVQRAMAREQGQPENSAPTVAEAPPTLAPGQSATISVTITPSAPRGTRVRGHLYVDTVDGYTGDADELVDLPYAYTVG